MNTEIKEMRVSVEAKKKEAIKRMKALGIFKETINQFAKDNLVSTSEPPFGAFYWVNPEQAEIIQDFEKNNNALVYLVVRAYTTFGIMDSFLFVSDYEDEWQLDNEDIEDGCVMSYTYNYTDPDCSEIGSIGVHRTAAAGLERIW